MEKSQRPRLMSELQEDLQRVMESVSIDGHGRMVPKVCSKLQANAELRISEDRWVKRVKTASHQGALFGLGRRLVQTSRPCKTTGWGAMVESEERRRR
jgi:hypothetical protein